MDHFLTEHCKMAIKGCSQKKIISFGGLNRPNLFLMNLHLIFDIQLLIKKQYIPIPIGSNNSFSLLKKTNTLVAMKVISCY